MVSARAGRYAGDAASVRTRLSRRPERRLYRHGGDELLQEHVAENPCKL